MPKRSLYARHRALVATLLALLPVCALAQTGSAPEPPCAACVAFVVEDARGPDLPDGSLNGLELLVRAGDAADDALASADATRLRAAMTAIRQAGGRAGLLVSLEQAARLDEPVLTAASRLLVDVSGAPEVNAALVFRLKILLSDLRGMGEGLQVGIAADEESLERLFEHDLAAYVDFTARKGSGHPPPVPGAEGAALVAEIVPVRGAAAPDGMGARWLLQPPAGSDAARRTMADVARAAPVLNAALVPGGTAEVRCGDAAVQTYLDAATLATVAVARGCEPRHLTIDPAGARAQQVRLSDGTVLVSVSPRDEAFTEDVAVVAERPLTVREVIARHQAAVARQRRAVHTLVSSGTMTLTFEAPGFPAPMTITAGTVVYVDGDVTEMEQRDIRVNGIAFRAAGVPKLPLLEPERVASPPLAIALTERYRYSLEGLDEVNGVRCHVVTFTPRDGDASLFAGRAWIAAATYALVRVAATQTGLRGPIVHSEQIDDFAAHAEAAWVLTRSEVRQMYEGAGHRTPIHRLTVMHQHDVNPADFAARRQAAYDSDSVMLRDTPAGLRYIDRDRPVAEGSPPAVAAAASSVRTIALGAVIDPNITHPLPFAGLSYVHFDLFGRGGQLNAFFGGTFGQVALSMPSVGRTRWKAGARAFAIASSYHDRAFVNGREQYAANLLQRPANASAWLLRPLVRNLSLRVGYELDYTHFAPAESTDPVFVVPAAQVAHRVRLGAEGQWRGYDVAVWWSGARRAGWQPWGGDAGEPGEGAAGIRRRYQRYGVTAGRSWIASPRLVGRTELAWMSGRDLDRFSRYTFGTFDNRLRGYPAALIRYDRGAVLRSSLAWAAGRLLRLDGFADVAYVRDPGFGRRHRAYSGAGLAAELPGPGGTLLGVEWGYGFQGLNADGRRGTQVVRVSAYKMF